MMVDGNKVVQRLLASPSEVVRLATENAILSEQVDALMGMAVTEGEGDAVPDVGPTDEG